MANWEILDRQVHRDLTIGRPEVEDRLLVQVVLGELESASARFPILFCKNGETGAFYIGAMLGLQPGKNLFAQGPDRCDVQRLFDVERQAFFVSEDAIVIDRDHARFREAEGQSLFEADGAPASGLRRVQRALAQLKAGLERSDVFIKTLLDLRLIEPIDMSFNFDDGERLALEGLYSISRDTLASLSDSAVLDLFRSGFLQHIHIIIASLQHVSRLARIHNDRLADGMR